MTESPDSVTAGGGGAEEAEAEADVAWEGGRRSV
jgi:hypothetical protein